MTNHFALTNLSFSFDKKTKVLFFKDLNLSFELNKIHFIRGKNGAGKSTLFRILRGNIYSEESITGSASYKECMYDLSSEYDRDELSSNVRMVTQKFDDMLADQFTFTENLQLANIDFLPSAFSGLPNNYIVPPFIERFGIAPDAPVHLLSGGQRQILAILMALQKSASILLLDEPTAALDEKNGAMVMEFLESLIEVEKNLTILIICHDKELVEAYARNEYYYHIAVSDEGIRTIEKRAVSEL